MSDIKKDQINRINMSDKVCSIINPRGKIIVMWMDQKEIDLIDDTAFHDWGAKAREQYGILDVIVLARDTDIALYTDEQLANLGLRRINNAIKEGQVAESSILQHQRDGKSGTSSESSSGSGLKQSRQRTQEEIDQKKYREYIMGVYARTEHLFGEQRTEDDI